jgi:hypothetical protein
VLPYGEDLVEDYSLSRITLPVKEARQFQTFVNK